MVDYPKMLLKRFLRKKINFKHFVFELTPNCTQECIYCYNVWKHNKYPKGQININSWEKIISNLKNDTRIKLVSLSGGEPLLNPYIFDIINILNKQKININLLSNGSKIDEKTAEKLVKNKISIFEIPLVAPNKEDHKKVKGVDDFDKVVEGIANIKHAGGRIITVFVATNKNIHLLKETLDLAVTLGSRGLMFNRINPASKEHITLLPSKKQLEKSLEYLNQFSKKFNFPISCSIPMPPCVIDMKKYPNISHGYCPSGNHKSYYTIDFLGNVRICNHTPKIIGNLLEQDFKEIIKNEYVEEFKKVLPTECSECKMIDQCRGGCKASSEVCYGRLSCMDPFAKINTK